MGRASRTSVRCKAAPALHRVVLYCDPWFIRDDYPGMWAPAASYSRSVCDRLLKNGGLHITIINQTSREKSACLQVAHEMVPVAEQVTCQREKEKVSPPVFQTRPHFLISTLPSLSVSLSTCPSISIPAARQRTKSNCICCWDLHMQCFT